jgi:hypothetical protein
MIENNLKLKSSKMRKDRTIHLKRRSYAAAMQSEATKLQSVTKSWVMLYGDTAATTTGTSPLPMNSDGRLQPARRLRCEQI